MTTRVLRLLGVFVLGGAGLAAWNLPRAAAQDPTSEILADSLDNFDSAFEDLKDERDALRDEIEKMKMEQRSLIDNVRTSIEVSDEERDAVQEELLDARSRVRESIGQRELLAERAAAKEAEADRASEALVIKDDAYEDLARENERLKKQLMDGEQTYARAADRILKLQADKESLEKEVEALRENHRKTLFGREDEVIRLKLEKDSLAQQLALAQQKVQKDAGTLVGAEQALRENDILKRKAEEARRALDDQAVANSKLQAEKETLLREIDQLREGHKKVLLGQNELVTKAKLDRDALAQQMATAVERERVATQKAADLERRLSEVERKYNEKLRVAEEKASRSDQESVLARQRVTGLEAEKAEMRKQMGTMKAELEEVYRLRIENKALKDQAVSSANKQKAAQGEHEALVKGMQAEFTRALAEERGQLKAAQEKIKSHAASEAALIAARDRNALLEKERDGFLKKIDLLSGQLVELNGALAKNTSLEKENRLLKAGLDKATKELSQLGQEHEGAVDRFNKERSAMEAARKEYEKSLKKIEEAEGLIGQNASLLDRTKAAETKLKRLLDQMIAIQDENEQMKSDAKTRINPREFKDTMNRNKILSAENANYRDQLAKLMKEKDDIRAAYDILADEKKDLLTKIGRMEESLRVWDSEKKQQAREQRETLSALEGKDQKLGEVSDEIRKIVSENRSLKAQVDSFPSKLSSLNARVQELSKENGTLHYNLGVIHTERRAYPEAIREFKKALDNRPDDAYAHYNLGILYSQYEIDEAKAVEHFQKYLKFAPQDDKDANMARKYLFTRESYESEKRR